MAPKKEHRLSIRFEDETLDWIDRVAKATDRDASWVVRWALGEVRGRGLLPVTKIEAKHLMPGLRKAGL